MTGTIVSQGKTLTWIRVRHPQRTNAHAILTVDRIAGKKGDVVELDGDIVIATEKGYKLI